MQNKIGIHCSYHENCHDCYCDVEVNITKTSGGYGLQGGVLCETNPQNIYVLCLNCCEVIGKAV